MPLKPLAPSCGPTLTHRIAPMPVASPLDPRIGRNLFASRNELTTCGPAWARMTHEGDISIMPTSFLKTILSFALLLAISFGANAAQPFDAKAFQDAQRAGKTILVDVTAPWCPTCKVQRPIIQSIETEKPNLVVYEVDFDTAKDVLKQFRVQYQSTLIVFKGAKEVGRSTGQTDPALIRALVAKGF